MSKDPNKRPIIIKKVKKVAGGHHGGAWKVAYADFVTAMMAFFLLLWLLAQAPKEKLKGLADYFTPTVGIEAKSGVQLKGATGDMDNGIKTKPGAAPSVMPGAPPTTGETAQAPTTNNPKDGEYYEEKVQVMPNNAEEVEAQLEKKKFDDIQKDLNDAMEKDPGLKAFKDNLKIKETPEGLQIEITDLDGVSMFEIGSPKLRAETEPLLAKVSQAIQKVDNKVAIIGHTDSLSYKNTNGYSNWDLSADRANASRRFLTGTGLDEKRISKVEGKADRDPLEKEQPEAAQNRRISIILLKKSITTAEDKKSDGKPVDGKAPVADVKPTEAPAAPVTDTKPVDTIPAGAKPVDAKPADNKPVPAAALPVTGETDQAKISGSLSAFTTQTPNIPVPSKIH